MIHTEAVRAPKRRGERRRPVAMGTMVYSSWFERPVVVDAADLSADGMFLVSDLLLEPGERVLVAFDVPGTRHRLVVDGAVARATRDGTPGMGLAFDRLCAIDEGILRRALTSGCTVRSAYARGDGAFRC